MRNIVSILVVAAALLYPAAAQAQAANSVAEKPGAASPSGSDPALQAFKNLSPEERDDLLQQALESYKKMSPEERRRLAEQAKEMGGDKGVYGAEWQKLLSPEQQKLVNDNLKTSAQDKSVPALAPAEAAPSQESIASILQQIKDLPPAQQRGLMNALKAAGIGDPAKAAPK